MLRNYLRTSLRSLLRHRLYAFINISGVSLGLACCLMTFLYVRNEYSVNAAFSDVERIYRINSLWREESMGLPTTTLAPVGPALASAYPEVECQARLYLVSEIIHVGEKNFRKDLIVADPSILQVFEFPLVAGDARTALSRPRSVVITDQLAETMFGTVNAIGRTMQFESWGGGQLQYTVTAVRRTLPWNSVVNFQGDKYDLIVPFNAPGDFIGFDVLRSWDSRYLVTYVKLSPKVSGGEFRRKLATFITSFAPIEYRQNLTLQLEPVRDLYLNQNNGLAKRISALLGTVAVVILLIACINYVTLNTVRSFSRMREIALRKVLGARRDQLLGQFLTESMLVSVCASLVAVSITELGLRSFLRLFGKQLVLEQRWDLPTIIFLLAACLLVGVLSGSYPALSVAAFNPARGLRGLLRYKRSTVLLRSVLVIGQFVVAIVLLIAAFGISNQIMFLTHKDLGFPAESILVIDSVPREWNAGGVAKMKAIAEKMKAIPGVRSASLSFDSPTQQTGNSMTFRVYSPGGERTLSVASYNVDEHFAETYGLSMTSGRFFSLEHTADSGAIVLNETAAALLPVAVSPGATTVIRADGRISKVIGVVKDFHFESMHSAIRPLAFVWVNDAPYYRRLSLRLQGADLHKIVARVESEWHRLLPGAPFDFFFADKRIDQFYISETQLRDTLSLATGIAFFIACMGMYGLALLTVAQRTKEIGIRKVLGSSVTGIVGIISGHFIKLVAIANIIAWPVGYFLVDLWLRDFAYRMNPGVDLFLVAGFVSITIALLTVGGHAMRAALGNPVDALRYE
jgi:putative ABC transport system permease protein